MALHSVSWASVHLSQRIVTILVNILKKASDAPDSAALVQARLAEDMLPFSYQVKDVGRHCMRAIRAATGKTLEIPELDYEGATTMAQLIEHAEAVQAVADSVKATDDLRPDAEEALNTFHLPHGDRNYTLKGLDWMVGFALPNAYFHLMTAYSILRSKGVPVGKTDYILPFMSEEAIAAFSQPPS